MRKFLIVIIVATLMVGCAGQADTTDAGVDVQQPETEFKVGLLMDGPINDQGWNATAFSGLMKIEEDLGATVSYAESVMQSDNEDVFRAYAEEGYDLVIGHGFNFIDAASKVAADYPETVFVCTSCEFNQPPNMGSVTADEFAKGFLGGVVAALVTETDRVAYLGGMEIPPIILGADGFLAGARYINPDIDVLVTYSGDFNDAGIAKEILYSFNDEQADIVMLAAGMANLGAAEAASETGVMIIGTNTDQYEIAPDAVITSAIADYPRAFLLLAQSVLEGSWEADSKVMGISEGVVDLAPYHDFEDDIDEATKQQIEEIKESIASGEIIITE